MEDLKQKVMRTDDVYGNWHFKVKEKNAGRSPTKRQRALYTRLTGKQMSTGTTREEAETLVSEAAQTEVALAELQKKNNGQA